MQLGSSGNGNGQFNVPQGVAVDSSGNIYVADTNNNRIQKFGSNGNYLTQWGISGVDDGQFRYPTGVTVDSAGNVYVADNNNQRIQKFAPPKPIQPKVLPVANFSSNVTSGYVPLDVQFTDQSKNATSLYWDFGDRTNSTQPNPKHTFSTSGNYTVTLTASNGNGSDSKSATITVIPPGNTTISFNPQKVVLQPSSSQTVQIVMDKVPASGLAGFNITVYVQDPTTVNITAVSAPAWGGLIGTSTVPSGSAWITAVDTNGQVHPGDTNVPLGNITITGGKIGTTNLR